MTFRVTIALGNAAMETGTDVAAALRDLAEKLDLIGDDELNNIDPYDRTGCIRDLNGNAVGKWSAGR